MKFFIIVLMALTIHFSISSAQEPNAQPGEKNQASAPLELPNFIIEGKEQVSVRAGVKQFPENPESIGGIELDSLNSLEKQSSLLLPSAQLPSQIMDHSYQKGWFRGSFGNFLTGQANFGYESKISEYTLFGEANLESSAGWTNNSEYNKLSVNLNSDYVAPKKFWIFGGSNTRTSLAFGNNNYKLFAMPSADERSLINLNASVITDGNYGGYLFNTGAGFRTSQLAHDILESDVLPKSTHNAFDNNIFGYLAIKRMSTEYEAGIKLDLDIHSIRGDGANFIEGSVFGGWLDEKFALKGKAGFQFASSTEGIDRGGLMFEGNIDYYFNRLLTFKGSLHSGLKKNNLSDVIGINPYINIGVPIDFSFAVPTAKAMIWYHPDERFSLMSGAEISSIERMPVFIGLNDGTFNLIYDNANAVRIFAESFVILSTSEKLTFNGEFNYAGLDTSGNAMPYLPLLKLSGRYSKLWMNNLNTELGIYYFGERYADLANDIVLSGFIDLKIKAEYRFSKSFNIFVNLENLLNSDIVIWQGYKERGTYFALGLTWQFD